jgi:tryptophan-rich sensory protein
MFPIKNYKWYHGLFFLVVVNLLTFAWFFIDVNYYNNLNKPWFAPPSSLFGIAWLVNNICVIYGNILALNLYNSLKEKKDLNEKDKVLVNNLRPYFFFQVLSWLNYIVFSALSFGTKIPSMFFWPTFSMLVLTIFSIFYTVQIDKNNGGFWQNLKKFNNITFTFLTLLVWLVIASSLGYFVWKNN